MPKLKFLLALALTCWVALECLEWLAQFAYDMAGR